MAKTFPNLISIYCFWAIIGYIIEVGIIVETKPQKQTFSSLLRELISLPLFFFLLREVSSFPSFLGRPSPFSGPSFFPHRSAGSVTIFVVSSFSVAWDCSSTSLCFCCHHRASTSSTSSSVTRFTQHHHQLFWVAFFPCWVHFAVAGIKIWRQLLC